MAKMDILMRAERVRNDIVISISSFTQMVEQFKDKHVYCLPVKSVCLLERRFKEHSLPILITNDRFKSMQHRVLANEEGPRISGASFFYPTTKDMLRPYGPIKELLSDDNKLKYKQISTKEFITYFMSKERDGTPYLPHFKLP
ncbi:hypothetical protein AgCh_027936 [Apium graveolens]